MISVAFTDGEFICDCLHLDICKRGQFIYYNPLQLYNRGILNLTDCELILNHTNVLSYIGDNYTQEYTSGNQYQAKCTVFNTNAEVWSVTKSVIPDCHSK